MSSIDFKTVRASRLSEFLRVFLRLWASRLKDPGFPVASPPSRLLSELPGRPSRFLPGGAPRSGRGGPSRRREATRKDPQATRKRPARPSRILPAETTYPAPLHAAPGIRATFLARPGREEGARPMSCKNRSDSKGRAAPRRERRSPGREREFVLA